MKPNGRMYRVSGEGLVQLDRHEFKALTLLVRYGGRKVEAEQELRRDPAMTDAVIALALELYSRREADLKYVHDRDVH